MYARVAGYVRQMKVDVGDRVKAGDVLAVLEIPELENDLQRASAAAERAIRRSFAQRRDYEAHLTYERLSEVLKQQPNLVAQQEIDEARARTKRSRLLGCGAVRSSRSACQPGKVHDDDRVLEDHRAFRRCGHQALRRYRLAGGRGNRVQQPGLVRLSQLDPLRLVLPVPESPVPEDPARSPGRSAGTGNQADHRRRP